MAELRSAPASRRRKVIQRDHSVAHGHHAPRDLEPDPLDLPRLNGRPSGLANPSHRRSLALRKALPDPPPLNLLSDVHSDHDSNRNLKGQNNRLATNAIAISTLTSVDDDRLTPAMVERVISLICEQIEQRFHPPPGKDKFPGGQRAIAEAMHLAQPTLNRLLVKKEGVGLDLVLGLRAYFRDIGHPMTIDELLWEHEAGARPASEEVVTRLMQLEDRARQFVEHPPSKKEARKYWEEVQRLRLTVAGTIGARRKAASGALVVGEDLPAENYEGQDDDETDSERKMG